MQRMIWRLAAAMATTAFAFVLGAICAWTLANHSGAHAAVDGRMALAAQQSASPPTCVPGVSAPVSGRIGFAATGSNRGVTAQPSSSASSGASVTRGNQVFSNVGCQACHTKTLTTAKSPLTGQSNVTIQPFSDFAVHEMGTGLADGVSQGSANGNEFRTAPLWGVGQRIFFLHDGRTKDLHEAIQQHASRGSEANAVINNYNLLSRDDKQALVNYLRSL